VERILALKLVMKLWVEQMRLPSLEQLLQRLCSLKEVEQFAAAQIAAMVQEWQKLGLPEHLALPF
jgi:hypothetical protein